MQDYTFTFSKNPVQVSTPDPEWVYFFIAKDNRPVASTYLSDGRFSLSGELIGESIRVRIVPTTLNVEDLKPNEMVANLEAVLTYFEKRDQSAASSSAELVFNTVNLPTGFMAAEGELGLGREADFSLRGFIAGAQPVRLGEWIVNPDLDFIYFRSFEAGVKIYNGETIEDPVSYENDICRAPAGALQISVGLDSSKLMGLLLT